MIDITFFVPTLNEESNIEKVLHNLLKFSEISKLKIECIFIDDGSRDKTVSIITRFIESHNTHFSNMIFLVNYTRKGLARNFSHAVELATGDYFRLINGDNSEPLVSLQKVMSNYQEVDITIPFYTEIVNRKLVRKGLSKVFTYMVNTLSNNKIHYYNGAPVYRIEILRKVPIMSSGMSYSAEVLVTALKLTRNYREIEITGYDNNSLSIDLNNLVETAKTFIRILVQRIHS